MKERRSQTGGQNRRFFSFWWWEYAREERASTHVFPAFPSTIDPKKKFYVYTDYMMCSFIFPPYRLCAFCAGILVLISSSAWERRKKIRRMRRRRRKDGLPPRFSKITYPTNRTASFPSATPFSSSHLFLFYPTASVDSLSFFFFFSNVGRGGGFYLLQRQIF